MLEEYGWVLRDRPDGLRKGDPTTYQLAEGRAFPARAGPVPDSVRAREYRKRRKAVSVRQSVTTAQVNAHSAPCIATWANVTTGPPQASDLGKRHESTGPYVTETPDPNEPFSRSGSP